MKNKEDVKFIFKQIRLWSGMVFFETISIYKAIFWKVKVIEMQPNLNLYFWFQAKAILELKKCGYTYTQIEETKLLFFKKAIYQYTQLKINIC